MSEKPDVRPAGAVDDDRQMLEDPSDGHAPDEEGGSTPDERLMRYWRWCGDCIAGYPDDCVDEDHWQIGKRFVHVLDCAALLLPEAQLDGLMRLLEHLDDPKGIYGGFFPKATAARLVRLPHEDFARLVSRQLAVVLADPTADVVDMAAWWNLGFTFTAKRGEVRTPGGDPIPPYKPHQGLLIDYELDDAQMDRLNAIPGITVTCTDAGHQEHGRGPYVAFRMTDGRSGFVESQIVNTGTNAAELHAWWEQIIGHLEQAPESLLGRGRG